MDVRLSPEQELFAQVAADLAAQLASRWDLGRGPSSVTAPVPDARAWQQVCDAGLLALRLDEEQGGVGAGCLEACLVVEQMGRHAAPGPVLGTLLLVEQLRRRGADPALLAKIAAGGLRLAPTLAPDLRGFADTPAGARAFDCAGASGAVVVGADARIHPVVDARCIDPTREVGRLDGDDGAVGGGSDMIALQRPPTAEDAAGLTAFGLALLSADLLGVMGAALDAAVGHAASRTQFGAPIGSFQAVQHLAAEALVSVEATRSAVWYAAWAVDELPPTEALRVARTTKAFAATEAVAVTETCIQIFGGMGMTWEAHPHVWARRAHLDRRILGDEHLQYELLAEDAFAAPAAAAGRER